MTPGQFLRVIEKQAPAPVYLFIGPDLYMRDQCRRALAEKVVPGGDREQGFARHDLDDEELAATLDDARTLSLFASRRLIWISSAEGALPRGRAAARSSEDEDGGASGKEAPALVAAYVRDPTPETVVVFDSSRFAFEGDDKPRMERVQKFYSAIPNVVEFRSFEPEAALELAERLARAAALQIGRAELGLLVDALGADAARIASEIEKLSTFAGSARRITTADLASLIPNAHESTISELVSALGAGNREQALMALDALVREGEYLPLALSYLGTLFRLALVARDAGARTSGDIQTHFNRLGIRVWRDRADQIRQTLQSFPKQKLERALREVFYADRGLRDARPDDRVVIEKLILSLTA